MSQHPSPRACLHVGPTRVALVEDEPIAHLREAVVARVNARGIMASGFGGALRLAGGPDVERTLRAQAPLILGTAVRVGTGRLRERGVRVLVCAIASPEPGRPPRRDHLQDAIAAALQLVEQERARGLTLPLLGLAVPAIEIPEAAGILASELGGHLRRGSLLDEVIVAGLHPGYLDALAQQLRRHGATG